MTAVRSGRREWARGARAALERSGHRRSSAREAVVDLLAEQSCALTAQQIDAALRRSGRRPVGRATVYRTLDRLSELKLVTRVDVGQGTVRYEPFEPGGEHHHHHLVCDACGQLTPFDDAELERAIARIATRTPFAVSEHDVVLHGVCRTCQGDRPAGAVIARTGVIR